MQHFVSNSGSVENFPQQPPASESPHIPPRSMPVPQGPRRAAPPRKKSSQKQTPPAEPEATTPSFEKDTSIHDVPEIAPGSQTTPVSVPVEPEVDAATDPNANVRPAETADENLEPITPSYSVTAQQVPSHEAGSEPAPPPIPPPPPLDFHSESPDELEVEPRPKQGLPSPDDVAESVVPSIPAVPRITQEETEVETVVVPEYNEDEASVAPAEEEDEDETARKQRIAECVAKMGGFNPFGGQPMRSPSLEDEPSDVERKGSGEVIPVEGEGTTLQSEPAALAAPTIPYSVFQQDGSATVNEEGDDDDDGNDGKY
jgi:myosin tail region-interacting protein MTI1